MYEFLVMTLALRSCNLFKAVKIEQLQIYSLNSTKHLNVSQGNSMSELLKLFWSLSTVFVNMFFSHKELSTKTLIIHFVLWSL